MPRVASHGGGFIVKLFKNFFRKPRTAMGGGRAAQKTANVLPSRGPTHPPPYPEARPLPRPETNAEAVRRSNPNFPEPIPGKPVDPTYTENCTNCVVAAEHRRRGWDVTAKGRPEGGRFGDPSIGWLDPHGQPVKHMDHDELIRTMPDGARGSVYGVWKDAEMGHIFSWEKRDGRIHYSDPQIHQESVSHVDYMIPETVAHYRTDDATWIGDPTDWFDMS